MTLRDVDSSAYKFKNACQVCNGTGRAQQFTEENATMHQINPPYRGAAMVKCPVCEGTGKRQRDESAG